MNYVFRFLSWVFALLAASGLYVLVFGWWSGVGLFLVFVVGFSVSWFVVTSFLDHVVRG